MEFRLAQEQDFDGIKQFYIDTIIGLKNTPYDPDWKIGIYPSDEYVMQAIRDKELYITLLEGKCVSAMILNGKFHKDYERGHWLIDVKDEDVSVVHTFAVLPSAHGKGIGKLMIEKAIELSRQQGKKTLRLDVIGSNRYVNTFYEKLGFTYIETIKMQYLTTGLTDFILYEYVL